MKTIEVYLQHIDRICGERGRYFRITDKDERPSISIISYTDVPETGCTTAFSFGLSSIEHKEWVRSRPELVISVNSVDTAWPLAMGELIRNGRDRCLFNYGMILNFGQPISDESLMSSFLVYACTVLEEVDLSIPLQDRKVHLSQIYPIYQSEAKVIEAVGPDHFVFHLGIDLFDVHRPPYEGKEYRA